MFSLCVCVVVCLCGCVRACVCAYMSVCVFVHSYANGYVCARVYMGVWACPAADLCPREHYCG